MDFLDFANTSLVSTIKGRYITLDTVKTFCKILSSDFKVETLGTSVLGETILKIQVGTGNTKVLMWSQMHGNESTTTKGLLDFLNFLNSSSVIAEEIKKQYTLYCIPILNPDGAKAYTRVNANGIDLNRDAKAITQPESKILREAYLNFKPDYCFNLHDQRTIFGTEGNKLPATMSFLAPAYDESRAYNKTRLKAISIISKMNTALQQYIPNQVGRFDDSFNDNCIGDYLITQKIPTILFEAGHFQNDYQRDIVRKFVFIALLSALINSNENDIVDNDLAEYLKIPQNIKSFYDFYYKNISYLEGDIEKTINFVAQFEEVLKNQDVIFQAKISNFITEQEVYGHEEFDGEGMLFSSDHSNTPKIGQNADFSLGEKIKFENGTLIK